MDERIPERPIKIMRNVYKPACLLSVLLLGAPSVADSSMVPRMTPIDLPIERVAGWTCSRASSCAEAVREWCAGYSRADGDGDGIPCENVCGSRAEVDRIRSQIGC